MPHLSLGEINAKVCLRYEVRAAGLWCGGGAVMQFPTPLSPLDEPNYSVKKNFIRPPFHSVSQRKSRKIGTCPKAHFYSVNIPVMRDGVAWRFAVTENYALVFPKFESNPHSLSSLFVLLTECRASIFVEV